MKKGYEEEKSKASKILREEEKVTKVDNYAYLALKVLQDVVLRSSLILNTFDMKERFNEISTYQKEAFDILWKIGKIMKPVIGLFIPPESLFLLDSSMEAGIDRAFLVVNENKKNVSFELKKEVINKLRLLPDFKEASNKLIENYETIISNIVGYADILEFMNNYNTKIGLFKYGLSLAHEGEIFENSSNDSTKIKEKYLQALIIFDLILKTHHELTKKKYKPMQFKLLNYELIDEHGRPIGGNNDLDENVNSALKFNPLSKKELEYMEKIMKELESRLENNISISGQLNNNK